nr:unnamed protein product [Digitaria exilis]
MLQLQHLGTSLVHVTDHVAASARLRLTPETYRDYSHGSGLRRSRTLQKVSGTSGDREGNGLLDSATCQDPRPPLHL